MSKELGDEFSFPIISVLKFFMQAAKTLMDLIVWQKAHQFVIQVYSFTAAFPRDEMFGLAPQYRRAAVSIAANIAEGFKKISKKDKARFMNIAQSSLEECRYYQILCKDLNYGNNIVMNDGLEEVSRLLNSYHKSIIQSKRIGHVT